MKKYVITFTDGTTRTIEAERFEEGMAGVTFYDDNGDELATFAAGTWRSIEPQD